MSDDKTPADGGLEEFDARTQAIALLSTRDREALEVYERGTMPPVNTEASDKLFRLFLRGLSVEDIRQVSDFTLGQIVDARVRYHWDRRRAEYDLQLVTEGKEAWQRSQLEIARLAADALTASARLQRKKIHKFLQTDDETHIEGMHLTGMRNIRDYLEILMRATRQDQRPADVPPAPPPEESQPPVLIETKEVPKPASLSDLAASKKKKRQAAEKKS